MSWQETEEEVRRIASYIWDRTATSQTIAGVKCDCVLEIERDHLVVVEITQENSLNKIRTDILKLRGVKSAFILEEKYAECYFVMLDTPTDYMRDFGKAQNVKVMSIEEFRAFYFDYASYVHVRSKRQFGSLVDSVTGEPEDNTYINVTYTNINTGKNYNVEEIIDLLKKGRKIILKGDFGVGKSRCIKQIFEIINKQQSMQYYTIAVNLREYWGMKRGTEILYRHFQDLGLRAENFMKSYNNPKVIYLLDGFDEIGTQMWTTDAKKMRHTREVSVAALKDLAGNVAGGVLISGREYYFNSDKEMLSSFGMNDKNVLILECRNEFTDTQIQEFLKINCGEDNEGDEEKSLPEWLPKRPLVVQLVLKCAPELLSANYNSEDIWDFWDEFFNKLCEREARINSILNPDTIRQILILLAQKTRNKKEDVGPLSLMDLSAAFEEVVGMLPNDESSIMLQRLPGMGRINADSQDRQFLDLFILNGLRAENIIQIQENITHKILSEKWDNPMDLNGCTILAAYIQKDTDRKGNFLNLAIQASKNENKILAGDIISSISLTDEDEIDYKEIYIKDSYIKNLLWEGKQIKNLFVESTIIENLDITNVSLKDNIEFKDCMIKTITGISSESGIPLQFHKCSVENFEAIATMSRIKKAKLSMPQKIFVAIIKKLFFQPGRGRKVETLLHGFGESTSKRYVDKILNKLLKEGIVERHKGDEGYVYKPVRDYTARMRTILTQLTMSEDKLWEYVSKLDE